MKQPLMQVTLAAIRDVRSCARGRPAIPAPFPQAGRPFVDTCTVYLSKKRELVS